MSDRTAHPPTGADVSPAEARRVMRASVVGTAIEFYDFTLYGFAAVLVFGPQFFPASDPVAGQLGALATFAVGFVVRPLGAVVGGHFGDRFGRKRVLIATFLTMGLATVAMALVPTYASIGLAAPAILLVLRLIQGLAAGAEWGGAALMAVEHAPRNKRGLYGIAPALGTNSGILLAVLVMLAASYVGPAGFVEYGWRLAFGFSAVLVVFGFVARRRLTESPLFTKAVEQEPPRVPLVTLIKEHPGALLRGVVYVLSVAVLGYTLSPYAVGWAVSTQGYSQDTMLLATAFGSAVGLVVMVLTGLNLDGKHRRYALLWIAIMMIPAAIVFFPLLTIGGLFGASIGMITAYVFVTAYQATAGSVLAELFPTKVAYTGVSMAYSLAYVIAGFLPLVATSIVAATGSVTWVVVINVVVALLSLTVAVGHFRRAGRTVAPAVADEPLPQGSPAA